MYRVLDVREIKYAVARSCGVPSNYSSSVSVSNDTHHEIVVICVDPETDTRKRFVFYDGRKSEDKFWGTHYYGYKGDFDCLVAGDLFEIEYGNNKDYDRVTIILLK